MRRLRIDFVQPPLWRLLLRVPGRRLGREHHRRRRQLQGRRLRLQLRLRGQRHDRVQLRRRPWHRLRDRHARRLQHGRGPRLVRPGQARYHRLHPYCMEVGIDGVTYDYGYCGDQRGISCICCDEGDDGCPINGGSTGTSTGGSSTGTTG